MMKVSDKFAVKSKGKGRPDYSEKVQEVADISRGKVYPEFSPDPAKERFKVFVNSFPPGSELAIGATVPLLDIETFLPVPYTSPAGYHVRFAEWMGSFDNTTRLTITLDDYPPFIIFLPVQGDTHEYEKISFFDSRYWNPNADQTHTWNFTITNTSGALAVGSVQTALILELAGTEPMEKKTVRCPKCRCDQVVPIKQNMIVCKSCGHTFSVPFFGGDVI